MAIELGMGIDIRVTPALHPQNVASMEEYDSETEQVLEPTMHAFKDVYTVLMHTHDAREAAKTNPTWNEEQQVLETAAFADKQMARATGWFNSVRKNVENSIKSLETALTAEVTSKAAQSVSAEIRAHMKALPTTKALSFLQEAINNGDEVTASAILGAPPYLSGIAPATQAIYLRMFNEKQHPATAKRLRVFKAAAAMIDDRSRLISKQFELAVGLPPEKIQALRSARTKAEKAFILRET